MKIINMSLDTGSDKPVSEIEEELALLLKNVFNIYVTEIFSFAPTIGMSVWVQECKMSEEEISNEIANSIGPVKELFVEDV